MPLKFVRRKVNRDDSLHLAITATSLTRELVDLAQFPPARALVSVLLLIFETIQQVQTNKDACNRLASRAARLLLDINDQMHEKWDSAPAILVKNLSKLQSTLTEIHDFMLGEITSKWGKRFLRKMSIENALEDYNAQLDDAAQSFQIATLISIHYAVSSSVRGSGESLPPSYVTPVELELREKEKSPAVLLIESEPASAVVFEGSICKVVDEPKEIFEDHGFRRYHQSEIRLSGRSKTVSDGWWEGTEVQVNGQTSLLKRYDGPKALATKAWLRDLKLLQNAYHPGLPQLVGLSDERTPAPFILLANVKTRSPQALLLEKLRSNSLASCAELLLRFYRDIVAAATYAQRQYDLSIGDVQNHVGKASFRIDSDIVLVMGLPPPTGKNSKVFRSYGLTESFLSACLDLLPSRESMKPKDQAAFDDEDIQRKIDHLIGLARGLLPSAEESHELCSRVTGLLEDSPDDERVMTLTLDDIRRSNLAAGMHGHRFNERMGVPAHRFSVGEIGYVQRRSRNMKGFVKLLDVVDGFEVTPIAVGQQWSWERMPMRREEIEAFELARDVHAWPVPISPSSQIDVTVTHEASISVGEAWSYLLDNAERIAREHSVHPDEIVFVTRAGVQQSFYVRQVGALPFGSSTPTSNPLVSRTHPNFHARTHQQVFANPMQRQVQPAVVYLFTSPEKEHQPYWSEKPNHAKGKPAIPLDRKYIGNIGWSSGFVDYVQLHRDDFPSSGGA